MSSDFWQSPNSRALLNLGIYAVRSRLSDLRLPTGRTGPPMGRVSQAREETVSDSTSERLRGRGRWEGQRSDGRKG